MAKKEKDFSGLMNPQDFNSLEFRITADNVTTRTKFKSFPPVAMLEIRDRALVIEASRASCAKGHRLLLHLEMIPPSGGTKAKMSMTTVVENIESASEHADRITVALVQYEEKQWQVFLNALNSRQDEIEQFMRSAKGF